MIRIAPLPAVAAVPMARLHVACFPEEPWDSDAFARLLSMAGCFGWIAWDRQSPAGFALARDLGNECEILSLGVAPRRRRRGTACELLAAVIAEARRRDLGSVVLEVAVDNHAARSLYAKLGFNQVGMRPRYYRRRTGLTDALILRLMLNLPACLS
jgi:[ribosomal protein S18]-alanine N-acetyltransferase